MSWKPLLILVACSLANLGVLFPKYAGSPLFVAVGSTGGSASAITPGFPTGSLTGDLWIMCLETGETEAITVSTWTEAPGSPVVGTGTRLTVFYTLANAALNNSRTTSDSGDHQIGKIIAIKAGTFNPADPFDDDNFDTQASTTSVSIPGVTTTLPNTMVVGCSVGDLPDTATTDVEFGTLANASLTGLTEFVDRTLNSGHGGALFGFYGFSAAVGVLNATTTTAANAGARANWNIAINGAI